MLLCPTLHSEEIAVAVCINTNPCGSVANMAAVGVSIFLALVWLLGWFIMWWLADRIDSVQPVQHIRLMPPTTSWGAFASLHLKMVSVRCQHLN